MSTSRIDVERIRALEDAVEELKKAVAALQVLSVAQTAQAKPSATLSVPGISRNPKRAEQAQL